MKDFLAGFSNLETPFYFYDLSILDETISAIRQANRYGYHIHYALKANNNPRILERIRKAGFGVDCVSGNEIRIGLENDFDASHVVLAGVGKTDKEIQYAIDQNIFSFNVESIQELEVINEIATKKGKVANVSIRINPAIDAGTHHYITTGAKENKFGISEDELFGALVQIQAMTNIHFIGLHYHIGSQIMDLGRFKNLAVRVNDIQQKLVAKGVELPHLNVGGGLGIDYENPDENPVPDFETYFKTFHENLELLPGQELHFELGRSVVGQCGSLISRALYVKEGSDTNFLIIDAGMNDLMRPALYQAQHKVISLSGRSEEKKYDVVGPVCESSDTFGKGLMLPETKRGDFLVIRSAGAYGETMKNTYNARELAKPYYSEDF
ncbi:diaminopimelate decarboxylase [Marinoscillum furvescens]|uniref:Diaminopimelate decarboxylase n=1 Tax=Marinoscillum furvescens DSM 4134 TaxID=1122208 RepID=A0A3D9L0G7_MARFU|nr:diaminopimelate decarboxylase [Marinoscillum furvescens]RED94356.1 diaminopimelate decarboxylase [Marinoscillum furvescens DSM 4134]